MPRYYPHPEPPILAPAMELIALYTQGELIADLYLKTIRRQVVAANNYLMYKRNNLPYDMKRAEKKFLMSQKMSVVILYATELNLEKIATKINEIYGKQ